MAKPLLRILGVSLALCRPVALAPMHSLPCRPFPLLSGPPSQANTKQPKSTHWTAAGGRQRKRPAPLVGCCAARIVLRSTIGNQHA